MSGNSTPGQDTGLKKPSEGRFLEVLRRTNKQIKDDRAASISEDAQMTFRRAVEDLEMDLRRAHRDRENMLDLSPENTHSLILGKDFDAKGFVERESEIARKIYNLEIKLSLMVERYKYLFGN